jgi:hypothetical protein
LTTGTGATSIGYGCWSKSCQRWRKSLASRSKAAQRSTCSSTICLDCQWASIRPGKLAAALSRQHPRDLFDVGLLLEDERADQRLWRTFLVYLTCSPKPACEMLAPRIPADFAATFDARFRGHDD